MYRPKPEFKAAFEQFGGMIDEQGAVFPSVEHREQFEAVCETIIQERADRIKAYCDARDAFFANNS